MLLTHKESVDVLLAFPCWYGWCNVTTTAAVSATEDVLPGEYIACERITYAIVGKDVADVFDRNMERACLPIVKCHYSVYGSTLKTEAARHLAHSEDPNCVLETSSSTTTIIQVCHARLKAVRAMKSGERVTIDHRVAYASCGCGVCGVPGLSTVYLMQGTDSAYFGTTTPPLSSLSSPPTELSLALGCISVTARVVGCGEDFVLRLDIPGDGGVWCSLCGRNMLVLRVGNGGGRVFYLRPVDVLRAAASKLVFLQTRTSI